MRHAHRTHRPVYRLIGLTAVLGAATVGVVLLVSDGQPIGYATPKDASYGAPAAAAAPSTAVPADASTPTAGTASTSAPATPAPTTPAATTPAPAPPAADPPVGSGVGADGSGAVAQPTAAVRAATRGSGRLLAATLTGDVEVPGPGDPNGVGVAAVRVSGGGRICLEAVVTGVDRITKLHIHRGARGVAGPVAVDFAVTGTASSASCTTVDRALAGRIRGNPENWYVNVHTAAFEKGALRGQLMW